MSVFKRFNEYTGKWEIITTSSDKKDAADIITDNPIIVPYINPDYVEDDGTVTIEHVLQQDRNDIEILKKNVSWLALHGGGGQGGGGGASDTKVEILDPIDRTTPVSTISWTKDLSEIPYRITSKSASKYKVQIKINGYVVKQEDNVPQSMTPRTVSNDVMKIQNDNVTLQIIAYDESETAYEGRCNIIISNITLYDAELKTFTQDQLLLRPTINMSYRTTIAGNYYMLYSKNSILYNNTTKRWEDSTGVDLIGTGKYIELTTTTLPMSQEIDLVGLGLILEDEMPGTYNLFFEIVDPTNATTHSAQGHATIVVTITNGILVSPQIGASSGNRYTLSYDSELPLSFIAYSKISGVYSYTITCNGREIHNQGGNTFGRVVSFPFLPSSYYEIFDEPIGDQTLNYDIVIRAQQGGIYNEATCYITLKAKMSNTVKAYMQNVENYMIWDYTFWENMSSIYGAKSITYANNDYYYSNTDTTSKLETPMTFNRIGTDSGLKTYLYRFTHSAYARIDNSVLTLPSGTVVRTNRWFPSSASDESSYIKGSFYDFTFEIAYYIDEEVDDDATIFNFGTYNPADNSGYGILITAHNFYIKFSDIITGTIVDNGFTHLAINLEQDGTTYLLKVYQNGTCLKAVNMTKSIAYTFSNITSAYVACKNFENDFPVDNINVDVYSIRLFRKHLNVGQIICSYINNYVNYNRKNGVIDPELMTRMLDNNTIKPDILVPKVDNKYDMTKISTVYDFQNNIYDWGVSASSDGSIDLGNNIPNLPIPTVGLTVDWTFEEFRTETLQPSLNAKFIYFDPQNKDKRISCDGMTVSIQGTTTAGYEIKNVNITFPNGTTFSPKNTWFPESTFTLKADVVDSGHINNAVIGKFANDVLNSSLGEQMFNTTAFPAFGKIKAYTNESTGTLPKTLTYKYTVEGFPFLLIMNFATDTSRRDIQVLGIYSFNLGREAEYNLGYKICKKLVNTGGTPIDKNECVFPSLYGVPRGESVEDNTLDAYCYEGNVSHNVSNTDVSLDSVTYNYAIIKTGDAPTDRVWISRVQNDGTYVQDANTTQYILDKNGEKILWNTTNVQKKIVNPDGYFWSTDSSFISELWVKEYGLNEAVALSKFSQLNDCVARKMAYHKGNKHLLYDELVTKWKITSHGSETITTASTTETFPIYRPQAKENLELSITNTAVYYVICMLFGLVDNFGKNLQFKTWIDNTNPNVHNYWSPALYDLDTGIGLDNAGAENIPPTVYDESIYNDANHKVQFMFGDAPQTNNKIFTVYSNKLWGCIENSSLYQYYNTDKLGSEENPYVYAIVWNMLRSNVLQNIDDIISTYFTNQLSKCGEIVYNYDYQIKYLSTAQIDFLHGTRINFIKKWLNERITFLDSIFGYEYTDKYGINSGSSDYNTLEGTYLVDNSLTPYCVSYKNTVRLTHDSGVKYIPIKTNKSTIIRSIVQERAYGYTYVPKNTVTEIIISDALDTNTIQTTINNPDTIVDISGFRELKLNNIYGNSSGIAIDTTGAIVYPTEENFKEIYYQYGSLSSLKEFDLSNVASLDSTASIDLFTLFKTWDKNVYGEEPETFKLQTIKMNNVNSLALRLDLSGTACSMAPEIYKSPFVNIVSIDVSNSKISSVVIPSGVSLFYLNIANSSVASISLTNQPILDSISFSGCNNLRTVELIACENFKTINFTPENVALETITIADCPNLESITINSNGAYNHVPDVSISNCPKLKTVTITKCNVSVEADNSRFKINGCNAIEKIDLNNSLYKEFISDYPQSLNTLNLSNTRVSLMYDFNETNPEEDTVDMTKFDSTILTNRNFANNPAIKYVRYANNSSKYFTLSASEFEGCTNLERVYGNIELKNSKIFYGCTKFSIHGVDCSTFAGVIIKNQYGEYKHPYDSSIRNSVTEACSTSPAHSTNLKMKFISGTNATNMVITDSVSRIFEGTACTIWDVYYILFNICTSNTIDLSSMWHSGCSNIRFEWRHPYGTGEHASEPECNNSPSRYMFINCTNASSVSSMFYGCPSPSASYFKFKIYSPYRTSNGAIVPGLFTPLQYACTSIAATFSFNNSFCDRYVLRNFENSEANKFKISSMQYFCPWIIIPASPDASTDNVENLTYTTFNQYYGNTARYSEISGMGDISEFFVDIPKLGSTLNGVLYSTIVIDYDSNNISIPSNVTIVRKVFNSSYAKGTMNVSSLFTHPEKIVSIFGSFTVNNKSTNNNFVTMPITNDMFNSFIALTNIGYDGDPNFSSTVAEGSTSFSGNGLVKTINQEAFPYDIFRNCTKLEMCVAFFRFCNTGDLNTDLRVIDIENQLYGLPGNMFTSCPNLKNVEYLFYDFGSSNVAEQNPFFYSLTPYDEETNMPFGNCHALNNVRYMFGSELSKKGALSGSIPNKLFYHGISKNHTTDNNITGTDYMQTIGNTSDPRFSRVTSTSAKCTYNIDPRSPITYVEEHEDEFTTYIYSCYSYQKVYEYGKTEEILSTNGDITLNPTSTVTYAPLKHTYTYTSPVLIDDTSTIVDWSVSVVRSETKIDVDAFLNQEISKHTYVIERPYIEPYATISDMEGCFQNANISMYSTGFSNAIPEGLKDYQPFTFTKINNVWTKRNAKDINFNKWTLMWNFNGDFSDYYNYQIPDDCPTSKDITNSYGNTYHARFDYLLQDEAYDPENPSQQANCVKNYTNTLGTTLIENPSGYYAFAPDLLRYCTSTVNISKLFYHCGPQHNNVIFITGVYGEIPTEVNDKHRSQSTGECTLYGLKGRICPYMLKPVPGTSNLSYIFADCKYLTGYHNANGTYILPKSFLSYLTANKLDINNAFRFWLMPHGTKLNNIFVSSNSSTTKSIDGVRAFWGITWSAYDYLGNLQSTNTLVSDAFIDDYINVLTLREMFMVAATSTETISPSDGFIRSQPVTYSNMFKRYNKTGNDADYRVFYHYGEETTFGVQTLSTDTVSKKNYVKI